MIQAFGYCRISGRGRNGNIDATDSFPRQREAIEAFGASAGIEIVQFYEERATTGKTEWEEREAWTEMLLALNGVTTIIVEKLDRLARDLMVQEHIIADLRKRGITLISAAEPDLCIDDPSRKLLRQIMGAIAEYDRAMVVLKLRGARRRMRQREGYCEGKKPYGWRPEERPVLDRIIAMSSKGIGGQAIADALNADGVTTRFENKWLPQGINRILAREKRRSETPDAPVVLAEVTEPVVATVTNPIYTLDEVQEYIDAHDEDDDHDEQALVDMFESKFRRAPNATERRDIWRRLQ